MNEAWNAVLGRMVLAAAMVCCVVTVSRADIDIVTTTSEDGWFGVNEGPATSVGDVIFGPGPDAPPAGVGSATLTIDDTAARRSERCFTKERRSRASRS